MWLHSIPVLPLPDKIMSRYSPYAVIEGGKYLSVKKVQDSLQATLDSVLAQDIKWRLSLHSL